MRRALAFVVVLILVVTGIGDARGRGGGRGGGMRGGARPAASRPAPSRPVQRPSGGFSNFNGDFSGRQPVSRPPGASQLPANRPPGNGTRPGTRPPGTRPPGRPVNPPVPPQPAWGWNAGVVWAPAPYYYGGGFWGPYAWGMTTAVVLGSVTSENEKEEKEEIKSYKVAPDSPGAKVLEAYHLQQVECKNEGVVVIFGPEQSVVCATPNDVVAAGEYDLNVDDLTIYSRT